MFSGLGKFFVNAALRPQGWAKQIVNAALRPQGRAKRIANARRPQGWAKQIANAVGAQTFGRMAVGGAVGMYSSRNEEGLGWWGGIAGGVAAGGFLGRYMPNKTAGWIHRQLGQNKNYKEQFLAKSGTGLGGWARKNLTNTSLGRANKTLQYGMIAGVAGVGASLGSSTLRSNRPY
jgi:hypothetical protein